MAHKLDAKIFGKDIQSNPLFIVSSQRLAAFANNTFIRSSIADVIEVNEMAYQILLHI